LGLVLILISEARHATEAAHATHATEASHAAEAAHAISESTTHGTLAARIPSIGSTNETCGLDTAFNLPIVLNSTGLTTSIASSRLGCDRSDKEKR
jgi:hypothetical protein